MGMRLICGGVIIRRRLAAVLLLLGSTGLCSNIQAATEIGAIPGTFAVSPTGAATYTIPINVPPGVAGLTPHLALVYDSQLGNGIAGYGWVLSGLSVITACNKTWAQDNINESVSFTGVVPDPNDYCLDGQKLLITSNGTYRKELDDFSQVTPYNTGGVGPTPTAGPQYFTVQASDGLTYEYGKTADSEIVATGAGVPSGVTMVRAWALDQIFDKYGNSISFTYQQDTTNGDFWPTQITYTNHGSSAGPHTIVFHYTTLASINAGLVWTSYEGGALISQTQRLNEIDVDYNGSPTFTYSLSYGNTLTDGYGNTGTERSRLTSVTECAGSTCYPATTINWQSGTSGWGGANAAPMGGNTLTTTQASEMQLIDINGDSRADIIYPTGNFWMVMLSNGDGFDAPQSTGISTNDDSADALPVDVNGDGHEGLLVPQNNPSNTLDWYLLEISVSSSGVVSATYTDTGRPAVGIQGNATVTDLNGDGLPDILYSDGTNLYWYENLGSGNFASAAELEAGAFSSSSNGVLQFQHQFAGATPDFDGSGRGGFATLTEISSGLGCTPDYCPPPQAPTPDWGIQEGGGYSNGATVAPTGIGGFKGDSGDLVAPMFVDFNADGLSDILYAPHTGPQDTNPDDWYVYNSTGVRLTGGDTGVGFDSNEMQNSLPVDYAGNGRQDVLVPMFNSSGSCTNLGLIGYAGGVFHGTASIGLADEGPCASGYDYNSIRVGDITGDGLEDLVWVANGTVYYALHNGVHPDLVISINNNFSQNYSNVSYTALSDTTSSVYNPGTASIPTQSFLAEGGLATVPEGRNYTGPVYVVTGYNSEDGVGGAVTHNFNYSGALLDTLGRGFLGFAGTTASDDRTVAGSAVSTTTTSNYDQWFPKTGDPTSITVSVNGNEESNVTTTWAPLSTLGTAQYVYASSSTTNRYELGASSPYASVTTSDPNPPTLNNSGVLTQQVVQRTTSPATVTSTTTTNYQTDTGNWCLDLPASVTVENTGDNPNNEVGGSDMSRTVTYTPDTQHCRITGKSVSVTDGSTTQTLSTTDNYDPSYGTLIEQDVNASSGTCSTQGACYTKYAYDSTNTFVASLTNALDEKSKFYWDLSLGLETEAIDPNGVTTGFSYDPFGLKKTEALGDSTSVQWSYCLPANGCSVPAGSAYSITATHYSSNSVAGKTGTTVYDSFGRPLLQSSYVVGGAQSNVATAYDALGRAVSVSTPYESSPNTYTYTVYDVFSRPSAVYTPAGQFSGCSASYGGETACETSYGYNGLSDSITDPKNNTTTKLIDALGEVTQMTDAAGGFTYYSYDAFGDLTQTEDPANSVTSMRYDTLGRKLQMTDRDMGTWNYQYDPRGLLVWQSDPKSQTITMSYDALGRLTSRTEPLASGGTGTDTWTYDGPNGTPTAPDIGKLVEVQGADGYVKQYQYDSAGRPLEQDVTIASTTYATTTAYDSFGRVASITYPSAPTPDADDPPVAIAGANQTAVVAQTVTLDGNGSYDPDHGPQPLSYKWTQTSGPVNTSADGATTSTVSFTSNVAGTYDFTLTVSDGELTDSASTSVALVPAQVTGLSASSVNPNTGSFTLSWTAPEGGVDYNIEQSANGGAYQLLNNTYSSTSASLTGYSNGSYSFAVQGCGANDTPCGAFSSSVSVSVLLTPGVPATPSVSPTTTTNGTFTLSWSQPSGSISYYELYTSFDGAAYSSTNVGNVLSKSVTETVNGTYDFEVAACNSAACSAPSSPVAGTVSLPVPAAPTFCCSASINQGQSVTLSWSPNGSVPATYYELESSLSSSFSSPGLSNMGLATSSVVSPRTTHYYRVEACNSAGCGSWSGTAEVYVNIIGGCKTCAPTAAPSSTTTPAPGASSGGPFASVGDSAAIGTAVALPPKTSSAHDKMRWALSSSTSLAGESSLRSDERFARDGRLGLSGEAGLRSLKEGEGERRIILPDIQNAPAVSSTVTVNAFAPSFEKGGRGRIFHLPVAHFGPLASELSALRRQALHAEMMRVVERQPSAHPAPQPLYAAEVEMPNGTLVGMTTAVAEGKVNPYRMAAHLRRVGTTSRYTVNYEYDNHGNLTEVVDAGNSNLIYWQATAGNAFGQVTADILGNGVIDTYGFDPNTGEELQALSGVGNSTAVANMSYQWDGDGNLTQRQDQNAGLTETFQYGSLNRLKQAQVSGAANSTQQFNYDAVGDLTSRTGVGTYNYTDASHPQQITSITAPNGSVRNFAYDPDGNITSDGVHTNSWDALNRLTQVQDFSAGSAVQFAYTPSGARYQETTTIGAATTTLIEVNALFEVQYSSATGHTNYRASIVGGTGVVAIRAVRDDGILTTRYVTGNHLGGVSVISDEVGTVDQRMSYGAFGERRDPTNWQPYSSLPDLTNITDKGYTGQQQLDAVGLIHMNGRVYDPQIGRFISADPTVPDPLDGQSFARYAYVENNPLSAVDPSGYQEVPESETEGWYHDANTGRDFCNGPVTFCYGGTNIRPTYTNQTMPSPVGIGQTPVPPAPTTPPAPPPQQQQQQQSGSGSQRPCDCTTTITNPNNPNSPFNGWQFYDGYQIGNCGTACGDGFVTGTPDWSTVGPVNLPRGPNLVEIPNAGAPIGGGPTVGVYRSPGSVGMTGGLSIGADAANAIKYGTQFYGPPLAPANTVRTIARTAGIIGRVLTRGAILFGAVKLYKDFYNPHSNQTTLALDITDLAVNFAALKSHSVWIIAGAALYDFGRLIQENAPPMCEGVCAVNNEIGYGASLPVIQQDLQQGVPIPGYPGP